MQEENDEKPPLQVKLPEIHDKSTLSNTVSHQGTTSPVKTKNKTRDFDTQSQKNSKLVFLTEKKATCKGQFAKRLNKDAKEDSNMKQSKPGDVLHRSKTPTPVFSQRLWEPLSMQALLEHQVTVLERRNEMSGMDSSPKWNVCT